MALRRGSAPRAPRAASTGAMAIVALLALALGALSSASGAQAPNGVEMAPAPTPALLLASTTLPAPAARPTASAEASASNAGGRSLLQVDFAAPTESVEGELVRGAWMGVCAGGVCGRQEQRSHGGWAGGSAKGGGTHTPVQR